MKLVKVRFQRHKNNKKQKIRIIKTKINNIKTKKIKAQVVQLVAKNQKRRERKLKINSINNKKT